MNISGESSDESSGIETFPGPSCSDRVLPNGKYPLAQSDSLLTVRSGPTSVENTPWMFPMIEQLPMTLRASGTFRPKPVEGEFPRK